MDQRAKDGAASADAPRALRVLVLADPTVVGDAVAVLVGNQPGLELTERIRPTDDLMAAVDRTAPDAVVIALGGPQPMPMTLVNGARELRKVHEEIGIVVVADQMTDFGFALLATRAGRAAFLLDHRSPDFASLPGAIREVCAGGNLIDATVIDWLVHRPDGAITDLNAREVDVLQRMAGGRSNRAIATDLCLSIKSVEKYVTTIFRKLRLVTSDMTDRRVLATLAFQRGVVPVSR
jgi:DNA-binding NarL/FixJ family response regulator